MFKRLHYDILLYVFILLPLVCCVLIILAICHSSVFKLQIGFLLNCELYYATRGSPVGWKTIVDYVFTHDIVA